MSTEDGLTLRRVGIYVAFVAVCLLVGGLGGWLTASSIETWYPTLDKPTGTPPSWVFGPVWTTLYVLIGIAGARAFEASWGRGRRLAMGAFGLQLGLNLAWSLMFFGLQQPGWALAEILVLVAAIGLTMREFDRIDRRAAALLVPYLAWVAYATYLNAGLWWLN
jgi:tryptophan-rich sensory protein